MIRESQVTRNVRPGMMATLNLFLETPPAGADLPPIRSKVGAGERMLVLLNIESSVESIVNQRASCFQKKKEKKVYVEPCLCAPARPRPQTDMMLFFKQYTPDPQHPTVKYAGRRLVPKDTKIKVRGAGHVVSERGAACTVLFCYLINAVLRLVLVAACPTCYRHHRFCLCAGAVPAAARPRGAEGHG